MISADRQIDRQTDEQTNRHTDRQRGRAVTEQKVGGIEMSLFMYLLP